jgi:hypothetical protein
MCEGGTVCGWDCVWVRVGVGGAMGLGEVVSVGTSVDFWWWLWLVLAGVAHEDVLGLFRQQGGSGSGGRPVQQAVLHSSYGMLTLSFPSSFISSAWAWE